MINVFVYTCLSAWRFEACREKDLASARCYFDQVPLERVGLGGFVVVDPEILTVVLAAFGKYNMPTCTVNLTCEASKHLSERFYWLKNIELRNRISRRTAHSGFCFLLFGEQAWKTKDSSPSYRDQTFSLWVYLYFTVVPRVPRCPFLAALTSPTGLARGQSTQWHSTTEGHFVGCCCRTGSLNILNYLMILVLISWWIKGYRHGFCNSMTTQMEFGCQAFSPYLAKIQKNVVFDFVKSIINYLVLYFLKWKYLSTSSFSSCFYRRKSLAFSILWEGGLLSHWQRRLGFKTHGIYAVKSESSSDLVLRLAEYFGGIYCKDASHVYSPVFVSFTILEVFF